METVSAKMLRLDLPKVLKQIEQGKEFLIIYRSKPVGKIGPLRGKKTSRDRDIYDLLGQDFGEVVLPDEISSVELVRADRK